MSNTEQQRPAASTGIVVGTKLRAKHGWRGVVVAIGQRPAGRFAHFAPGCRGDGTDVFIEWDQTDGLSKAHIISAVPREVAAELEVIN